MSVLLAYGTNTEAVIMSDSRLTRHNKDYTKIEYVEDFQKLFKIKDDFIIGSVGNALATSILKGGSDEGSFYRVLKNCSYREILNFFLKRIEFFKVDKMSYSVFITIGIDECGKIRMDTFDNKTCQLKTVLPDSDDLFSTIYLPPNIDPEFRNKFSDRLYTEPNKESFCELLIREVAKRDKSVNGNIQKYKVHK